ncbi:YcxB family protein [Geotalea uraniireducens]|uniref:YcxB family protein n=1 Tax=Geotalea uraniireducens TaxID=351604 RepID=UPI003899009D
MYALLLDNSLTDRIILFVLAGLSIPALYYYQKWKWHYHYNHSPYLNEPLKGIVTTDSIITEVSSGKSETPWSNFIKYKSTENIMLLYLGPNVFKTIARDFFTSTEDWEKAKLIVMNGMKKNS